MSGFLVLELESGYNFGCTISDTVLENASRYSEQSRELVKRMEILENISLMSRFSWGFVSQQ